jgi:hypothetical protein
MKRWHAAGIKPNERKTMKVKVINQISIKGELRNLFNYQYVANDGTPISAIFQATGQALENIGNSNIELFHFVDSL